MSQFELILASAIIFLFLCQLATLIAVFVLIRKIQAKIDPLSKQAQDLMTKAKPLLEQGQQIAANAKEISIAARQTVASVKIEAEACLAAVSVTTKEIAKITDEQAREIKALVVATTEMTRTNVERIDKLATRTALRMDDTASLVQRDVLRPLGEIGALLAALQSFLRVLVAPTQHQLEAGYDDDEMWDD